MATQIECIFDEKDMKKELLHVFDVRLYNENPRDKVIKCVYKREILFNQRKIIMSCRIEI